VFVGGFVPPLSRLALAIDLYTAWLPTFSIRTPKQSDKTGIQCFYK
jgi:hypothetical protein